MILPSDGEVSKNQNRGRYAAAIEVQYGAKTSIATAVVHGTLFHSA